MKRSFFALLILFAAFSLSFAEESLLPDDPSSWLGYSLEEVFAARGVPKAVSVARGPEAWQDDVVFEYAEGVSFYLFGNRLWQIRFGEAYPGSVFGIFVGDGSDKVVSLLGQPWRAKPDSLAWRLPWKGYPVELRIELQDSRTNAITVFRSDF